MHFWYEIKVVVHRHRSQKVSFEGKLDGVQFLLHVRVNSIVPGNKVAITFAVWLNKTRCSGHRKRLCKPAEWTQGRSCFSRFSRPSVTALLCPVALPGRLCDTWRRRPAGRTRRILTTWTSRATSEFFTPNHVLNCKICPFITLRGLTGFFS